MSIKDCTECGAVTGQAHARYCAYSTELPPPNPDEVELRALLNDAVVAFNALIIYAVAPQQHLGYLLSDDCRARLVEGDYLLNTVRDDVYHWWEELTPSPAV